jgi:hypothetical protein
LDAGSVTICLLGRLLAFIGLFTSAVAVALVVKRLTGRTFVGNAATSGEVGSPVNAKEGFAQAVANPAYIGITCGGSFFGHGVIAKGYRPATFRMNSFSVQ